MQAPRLSTLSDMGYIADGRVAGWIYLTNGNAAMLEWIISDPSTVPSLRKESLRKLVGFMVDTCLMLGYTNIFGISKNPAIVGVAKQFGFKSSEYTVYTLEEEVG